jgi:hypothetical protein
LAGGIVSLYQEYAYSEFFSPNCCPVDDADINAGALMGIVVVVQLILAVGAGSLVGLVFAGMSLKRKMHIFSFGAVALLFNLIPLLVLVVLFLRGGI